MLKKHIANVERASTGRQRLGAVQVADGSTTSRGAGRRKHDVQGRVALGGLGVDAVADSGATAWGGGHGSSAAGIYGASSWRAGTGARAHAVAAHARAAARRRRQRRAHAVTAHARVAARGGVGTESEGKGEEREEEEARVWV